MDHTTTDHTGTGHTRSEQTTTGQTRRDYSRTNYSKTGHSTTHRRVALPLLIHASNLEELSLTPFHLSTAGGLRRVIRGVREHPTRVQTVGVPVWADDRWKETRMVAAALQMSRPDAVVSHQSAARMYGWALPLRLEHDRRVHVTTEINVVRRPEFVGHRQRGLAADDVSGVAVAARDETLRQVSGLMAEDDLLALLEGMCGYWHGPPEVTPLDLIQHVRSWKRFRGKARLLRVIPRVRLGVRSPRETALRLQIMAAGLPEPVVAHPVTLEGRTFHPDLSYPDLHIAIEYEGDHHRVDDWQWDADIRREDIFREAGWEYLRITKSSDMAERLTRLERAYTERARLSVWTVSGPPPRM